MPQCLSIVSSWFFAVSSPLLSQALVALYSTKRACILYLIHDIYIKPFDTKWRHKVGSKENVEACAPGGGAGGAGWSDTMKLKVKGTEYGTVAQYINALQREQFFAIVAGVAIQQHTRMLMADLHMRADGMSVADVHTGLRQRSSTLRTGQQEWVQRKFKRWWMSILAPHTERRRSTGEWLRRTRG